MSPTIQVIIGLTAIVLGPVTAILISLYFQQRRAKRDAKEHLFLTLMANRRANPPTYEWAGSLNVIDVVFADHEKVVTLWHEFYAILCQEKPSLQTQDHKYLQLLSEMASVLGYKKLQQVDIDKFYLPRVHGSFADAQAKTANEWLRVLENTHHFVVAARADDKAPEPPEDL